MHLFRSVKALGTASCQKYYITLSLKSMNFKNFLFQYASTTRQTANCTFWEIWWMYKLYTFSSMKLFICLMSPNCKYSYKLVNIYIHVHSIFLQMSPKERQDSKKEVLFKQKPVIIGLWKSQYYLSLLIFI